MKCRYIKAVLVLLLSLQFAALHAVADNQKGTNCSQKTRTLQKPASPPNPHLLTADPYQTAYNYLLTFYPRWFTWEQASGGPCNHLIGPIRISPIYQSVVAINDDTLYTSAFIGAADEPVIVTIPPTSDHYSVLHLDENGKLEQGGMSGNSSETPPGVYGIVGPDWAGMLPQGIQRVNVQDNYTALLFRADKFVLNNGSYVDMTRAAEKFRRKVMAQSLSDYLKNPNKGATDIEPEHDFAIPLKLVADTLIAVDPIEFLRQTQDAVASPTTNPLSADEQNLSDTFDALFADIANHPRLAAGAQAGHQAIIDNYVNNHFMRSNWIIFMDMAEWDLMTFQSYLNRASITEYIQYGNNHMAAAYYQTFLDDNGDPLNGSTHTYTLTFGPNQQPETSRFWSLTAYTPETIELIPNKARKYVVASYTPGLYTAPDGSVTILMSQTKPDGFPEANWLPVGNRPFNIMLRDYGPEGTVANGTYVPPSIVPQ